jgi:hypothetical protein
MERDEWDGTEVKLEVFYSPQLTRYQTMFGDLEKYVYTYPGP